MRQWISLAFAPSLVRKFMTALNSIFWLSILPMGIGFQTKSKSKKCTCWLNGCYHSTDKDLHCTKMKKEILNCIEKYRVLRTYWTTLVYTSEVKKAHSSLQDKYWVFSRINVRLIKSISLSFIRWWGNVVYSVEKSYVDNLEAWKFLDLNLLRTALEFLIDQK